VEQSSRAAKGKSTEKQSAKSDVSAGVDWSSLKVGGHRKVSCIGLANERGALENGKRRKEKDELFRAKV
jgi:hypothetical protein